MKLLWCEECYDLVTISQHGTRKCACGSFAGRYLSDNVTAVVNENAIVVGIDNNSFLNAVRSQIHTKERINYRVDFFFCGWIPTLPGEVVIVDTVEDVENYEEDENTPVNTTSTMPTSAE